LIRFIQPVLANLFPSISHLLLGLAGTRFPNPFKHCMLSVYLSFMTNVMPSKKTGNSGTVQSRRDWYNGLVVEGSEPCIVYIARVSASSRMAKPPPPDKSFRPTVAMTTPPEVITLALKVRSEGLGIRATGRVLDKSDGERR
jgi:hypothetical protein